jgi:hypothetical protein
MFLHVAPMAKHFQILKPLVVLVTVPMVNAKARLQTVTLTPLAMADAGHKASRRLC